MPCSSDRDFDEFSQAKFGISGTVPFLCPAVVLSADRAGGIPQRGHCFLGGGCHL